MPGTGPKAYAFNRTRKSFLASELQLADTHWGRLRGLMGASTTTFPFGSGLWIVPCHGVHTLGMRFPIDVIYLDENKVVVHIEENVRPWSLTPVHFDAATVMEVRWPTVINTGTCIGDQVEIVGFNHRARA